MRYCLIFSLLLVFSFSCAQAGLFSIPQHTEWRAEKPLLEINFLTLNDFAPFSGLLNNLSIGLFALNKATSNEMSADAKNYLTNTAWPAVKQGSRELVAEISTEIVKQAEKNIPPVKTGIDNSMDQSIKKLFLAAAGLVLVIAGGQMVREALAVSSKKNHKKHNRSSRRTLLCTIGTGLVVTGIGAILFCDRITQFFTPL